jgi:molybdopterin-guanine dinucleotide biosynthesis protein A
VLKITKKSKDLAIIILIGGKSKRFGSDKGIYEYNGKPLISYQLETLFRFDNDIFLVANSISQVQNYLNKIDVQKIVGFIIDEKKASSDDDLRTPMIGLFSAFKELDKLGYEKVLALSCDTPLIKKEVIEYLIGNCESFDSCIPRWSNGFLEPLFAIYPVKKGIISAKNSIKNHSYKLSNLLHYTWEIKYIPIEKDIKSLDVDLITFLNINEKLDLEKLRKVWEEIE